MKMRCACRKCQVRLGAGLVLAVLLVSPVSTTAATFTVNASDDVDDGICNVAHCSLREAILSANTNSGLDLIAFNIPGAGPHTIQPRPELPVITDPVVIDGYTQPGASPNTNTTEQGSNAFLLIELDGSFAGRCPTGLFIWAGNSVVRGLVINRFNDDTSCGWDRSAIYLEPNGSNVVEGNFIGTDVTGTIALGNTFGIVPWSVGNTIGGVTAAARNVLSGNEIDAISMQGTRRCLDNIIQGNLIGTDVTGTLPVPNERAGVYLQAGTSPCNNNTIGGTTAEERNVISGNGSGITLIAGAVTGNRIQGNYIGLDVSGTTLLGNTSHGVHINGASDNLIGGMEPGAGNIISGNGDRGIFMVNGTGQGRNLVTGNIIRSNGSEGIRNAYFYGQFGTGSAYLGNSISDNGGLGVDLEPLGVTPNDSTDADTGPNNLQNFPVLSGAVAQDVVTIEGTLNSMPNREYMLEFFGNTECDPSGYGEGELLLGTDNVTTNASGDVAFTVVLPRPVHLGEFATATATDEENNTSEFSACIPIEVLPTFLPVVVDIKPDSVDNVINPRSRGRFWVAILSTDEFDALQADPASVRLGAGDAAPDKYLVRDSDYDAMADLLLRFRTPNVGIVCGDTSIELTGQTYDGVDIVGEDDVRTVGCKKPKPKKNGKKK